MIVCGYELHLYCDDKKHVPRYGDHGEFIGNTAGEARKAAREVGWHLYLPKLTAQCPVCYRRYKAEQMDLREQRNKKRNDQRAVK